MMARSRQKPAVFLDYFIRKVEQDQPHLLERANYILDLHHRQHPGYKSFSVVLTQLTQLVGDQYWSTVYHEFMTIWTQMEQQCRLNAITTAADASMSLVKAQGGGGGAAASGNASAVIDLTSSTASDEGKETKTADDTAGQVTPPRDDDDDKNKTENGNNVHLLSQVAAMQSRQPVARTAGAGAGASLRRIQLPLHPKPPTTPVLSLDDSNPFGPLPTPRETYAELGFELKPPPPPPPPQPAAATAAALGTNAVGQRHYGVLNQLQRQVKEETARAMVFVHNLLAKLQRESPTNLYPRALSVIEDCLLRNRQREIGYEMIAGHLVERLKALLVLDRTPAARAGISASPLTSSHKTTLGVAASATVAKTAPEASNKQAQSKKAVGGGAASGTKPKSKVSDKPVKSTVARDPKRKEFQQVLPPQAEETESKEDEKKKEATKATSHDHDRKELSPRKRKAEERTDGHGEKKASAASLGGLKRRMLERKAAEGNEVSYSLSSLCYQPPLPAYDPGRDDEPKSPGHSPCYRPRSPPYPYDSDSDSDDSYFHRTGRTRAFSPWRERYE